MQFPQLKTVDEFVEWEERQEVKYEFSSGTISLLPGARARHEIIVVNFLVALRSVIRDPAAVRPSGNKLLTSTSSRYADLFVTFDPRDDDPELTYARHPTLIVEVLSPTTERTDRGPKLREYSTIPELQEYALVDSRKRWAQVHRRSGPDWVPSVPIAEGVLHLESIGLTIGFDEIYAGTKL